jgi:hypothetical protein
MQMKLPSKRLFFLSILASLLGGVALAAYELNNLHRALTAGQSIAEAIAGGLGGTPSQITTTFTVRLCFGLIPLGRVGNPYLVIAVGDLILGTFITGFAIVLVYMLRAVFRRNRPVNTSDGESGNS